MKEYQPQNPGEELEARLTALILGELDEAQAAELRAQIAKDSELTKLYERLSLAAGLIREAVRAPDPAKTSPEPLVLSAEKRAKLLGEFKTVRPERFAKEQPGFPRWIAVAAGFLFLAALGAMLLPALSKAKSKSHLAQLMTSLPSRGEAATASAGVERLGEEAPTLTVDAAPSGGVPAASAAPEPEARMRFARRYSLARSGGGPEASPTAGQSTATSPWRTGGAADYDTTAAGVTSLGASPVARGRVEIVLPKANADAVAEGDRVALYDQGVVNGPEVAQTDKLQVGQQVAVGGRAGAYQWNLPAEPLSRGTPVAPIEFAGRPIAAVPEGQVRVQSESVAPPVLGDVPTLGKAFRSEIKEGVAQVQADNFAQVPPPVAAAAPATPAQVQAGSTELSIGGQRAAGDEVRMKVQTLDEATAKYGRKERYFAGVEIKPAESSVKDLNDRGDANVNRSAAEKYDDATTRPLTALPQGTLARGGTGMGGGGGAYGGALGVATPAPTSRAEHSFGLPVDAEGKAKGDVLAKDGKFRFEVGKVKEAEAVVLDGAMAIAENEPARSELNEDRDLRFKEALAKRDGTSHQLLASVEDAWAVPPAPAVKGLPALAAAKPVPTAAPPAAVPSDKPGKSPERRLSQVKQEFTTNALGYGWFKTPTSKAGVSKEVSNGEEETARKSIVPLPVPQPDVVTRENPFSTFSLNVSDVSYKLASASLGNGVLPEPGSIRSEEFINAFDYRDPEPAPGVPLAFNWEQARYPFAHNRDVLRFSLKTAAQGRQSGKPINLVLLLDNSGSMERADRVRIIREALRLLAAELKPQDKLSVVTFSRTATLRVDGRPGNEAGEALSAVAELTPEGGTNLEDALNAGYQAALRHYLPNSINRVVLLTDGAANLGEVSVPELKAKVEAHRKQGIALDAFGIGWEGYNDDLLEALTRNGDGRYGFLNSPEEVAAQFVQQLAGALQVAASDVKVQVEFNPARVNAYRQVGYARHQLTKQQFRDNTVDAAEIGAAEAGNAIYIVEVDSAGAGPLAIVRARYKDPDTGLYHEREWAVPYNGTSPELSQSTPSLRLATAASAFSEWLAMSPFAAEVSPEALLPLLSGVPEVYGADSRPNNLEWMIRQAQSVSGK